MNNVGTLAVIVVFVVGLTGLVQWLLDAPVFERGAASWLPTSGEDALERTVVRVVLAGLIPTVSLAVAAVLVFTAPFDIWVWGVVALLAVTVTLSPVLAVFHHDVRPPTPAEVARLGGGQAALDCEVFVVTDARDGTVNGYAIGGPFRDIVGVSEFALDTLPPAQVAALLAHEACHHRERHVLVRGAVSVVVFGVGAAVTTTLFDALSPLATVALVSTVVVERVVGYHVMRSLEFRADAAAARQTSTDAVTALLANLNETAGGGQARVPAALRVFSTHPSYAARIARLRG